MNIWHDIDEKRISSSDFIATIEISKGSKKKYELDKETGLIILDRILYTSTHYPANYGFIPRTLGDDKDPLDVLVICSEDIESLCLVRCYPIGVMYMLDNGANDEKIIAIPYNDPMYNMANIIRKHLSHRLPMRRIRTWFHPCLLVFLYPATMTTWNITHCILKKHCLRIIFLINWCFFPRTND